MRNTTVIIMTGIAFTFGIFLGLMLQLPVITLPMNDKVFIEQNLNLRIKREIEQNHEGADIGDKSSGTARKQLSFVNPLSLVKPSLTGIVYPINNASNPYLKNQADLPGSASDLQAAQKETRGISPVNESVIKSRLSAPGSAQASEPISGIYWTKNAESKCPNGFTSKDQKEWKNKIETHRIVKLENGCGRMQNRFLTFKDATHACARYRLNTDQIQGEIFSFYLSKLLNIPNVPPSSLHLVNSMDDRWKTVHSELANAKWGDNKVLILTQYVEDLKPSFIPNEFREDDRKLHPVSDNFLQTDTSELCDLIQWSDLIIFDYLTANLDRVVNNMFNQQWNEHMMHSPAHNLERTSDGALIFLDNESGLFHGYRLLEKYAPFHQKLLDALCVFRNSTASAIERLYRAGNAGDELNSLYTQNEGLHNFIPKFPQKNSKILQQRIANVYNHIQKCRKQFPSL